MSFKIEVRDDDCAYPVAVCDHCQHNIEQATDGNTLWLEDCRGKRQGNQHHEIRHTHKRCNFAFERHHPEPEGHRWMSQALDVQLFMLLLNTNYQAKQAKHTAELLGGLSLA